MGCPTRHILRAAFFLVACLILGVEGDTIVSGIVFCDQCKDGQISLLDYPIGGVRVSISCPGHDGQLKVLGEETTNWLGEYALKFDGNPILGSCRAQVSRSRAVSMACGEASGPSQGLKLVFGLFYTEVYTVNPLLSQPARPMPYCPRARTASPVPRPVTPALPPPLKVPPATPQLPAPRMPQLPPLPALPPMPLVSFFEASACPNEMWAMPEHRCYWKILAPDMKVAAVFGPLAAKRYGTEVTLWRSLEGRGDPYQTLLRESTTALLNSYNSLHFYYPSLEVVTCLNWALMGSTEQVLIAALRFLRANSGHGSNLTCNFTPCK